MADRDAPYEGQIDEVAYDHSNREAKSDHRTAQAEGWRKVAVGDAKAWKARAEKAEAENERLRETLYELCVGEKDPNRTCGECMPCQLVAAAKRAVAIDETEAHRG